MATSTNIEIQERKPRLMNETDEGKESPSGLVAYVTSLVTEWEDHRKSNYDAQWDEYYRLWRGIWDPSDKGRKSERSRIISPALQQAVENQVAEMEEAIFGREDWFVMLDDLLDQDKTDVEALQKQLLEDTEKDGVSAAISEALLNGALYGTGIAKIVVTLDKEIIPLQAVGQISAEARQSDRLSVKAFPVDPRNFVIDPAGNNINNAMGCAHVTLVPRHEILEKQKRKIYNPNVHVGVFSETHQEFVRDGEVDSTQTSGRVKIIEYYGLVPKALLENREPVSNLEMALRQTNELSLDTHGEDSSLFESEELVEAMVTIANDRVLLRHQENPFLMKDRPFVAFQHDTVPNRFWGRGVAEKGYNAQKALDGQLRAHMDGLALSTYPMIAMDSTQIPRDTDFSVTPGRTLLLNGDPNGIIREFKFSEPGPASVNAFQDFERMVQVGTGSIDSATPTSVNARNNTLGGLSIIQAGAVKRQKRTLWNIERSFLRPLIKKIAFRYMQFNPERYPFRDYDFKVRSGLGLIARELEQQQLVNLLQTAEPGSPGYWMILRAVWENSSAQNRAEMVELTSQLLQQSLNPQPPPPPPDIEIKKGELELKAKDLNFREQQFMWQRVNDIAKFRLEGKKIDGRTAEFVVEHLRNEADRDASRAEAFQKLSAGILNLAKAEGEEMGKQLGDYKNELSKLYTDLKESGSEIRQNQETSLDSFNKGLDALRQKTEELAQRQPTVQMIKGQQGPPGPPGQSAGTDPVIMQEILKLKQQLEQQNQKTPEETQEALTKPISIDRDENGLVRSVAGRNVRRNEQGLITEIE